jgi:hypothetical protein
MIRRGRASKPPRQNSYKLPESRTRKEKTAAGLSPAAVCGFVDSEALIEALIRDSRIGDSRSGIRDQRLEGLALTRGI